MENPDKRLNNRVFHNYAAIQARFQPEVPRGSGESGGIDLFLSRGCAILRI